MMMGTDHTQPPATRQALVDTYCDAVRRTDWPAMVAVQQELAVREEYDLAMSIRQARRALDLATTRLTASEGELSSAQGALAEARKHAPLTAERARSGGFASARLSEQAAFAARHAAAAIPALEEVIGAASLRRDENTQAVSEARAQLDRKLQAAFARVGAGTNDKTWSEPQ